MKNVIQVVKNVVEKAGIDKEEILTLGISNQRETAVCWNKNTGRPVYNAIVWQCARAVDICARVEKAGAAELDPTRKPEFESFPYFPASKIAWLLENEEAQKRRQNVTKSAMERLTAGWFTS